MNNLEKLFWLLVLVLIIDTFTGGWFLKAIAFVGFVSGVSVLVKRSLNEQDEQIDNSEDEDE